MKDAFSKTVLLLVVENAIKRMFLKILALKENSLITGNIQIFLNILSCWFEELESISVASEEDTSSNAAASSDLV